jgi:GR25 family glycosyltransferase involved in LPS biosynthesis
MTIDLNNYFDKIFYLNLDKDTDRNQNILNEFKKWNITNFERIPGEIITELPPQNEWRHFYKDRLNDKYIKGQLGCRASHLKAIKTAFDRGYKNVLIFEDDIYFESDPHQLLRNNMSNLIEGWDMLYLGGEIQPNYRNQIIYGHAYAVDTKLYSDILNLGPKSGMEIDVFYACIIQHMTYIYNNIPKYNIKSLIPLNIINQLPNSSNIQSVII